MPPILERAIVPLTDGLVAAFLFVLAANIGSFLNVVAHRLPRGESVVRGGSRCPACGAAIRWHDNVPVLGWLLLRGRCRDCRVPISPRYPLVEATSAVLLGTVASLELLTGGSNLPGGRFGCERWGSDGLLLHTDWLLVAVCILHCLLLVAVLASAILDLEGKDFPTRWTTAWVLAVFLAAVLLPGLQPVAVGFPFADWPPPQAPWRGGVASAAGIAAACVLGAGFGSRTLRGGLVLLAAGLGWQAAVTIAATTVLVAAARQLPEMLAAGRLRSVHAASSDLVVAAALQIILWRPVHHLWVVVLRSFFLMV
jgi:leader peptidase (prepilin peptidase)/N-methyltransferase